MSDRRARKRAQRLRNSARPTRCRDGRCAKAPGAPECTSALDKWLIANFGDPQAETLPVEGISGRNNPIVYVNGINTGRPMARDAGRVMAAIYDAPVHVVWNPTKRPWPDILQVQFVNKTDTPDATTQEVLRTLRVQLSMNSFVTLIGHSQGAAIVSSVLSFLSPAERVRVVITFGGAAYQYPSGTRSLRVVVNVQDVVPWLAGYVRAEKLGLRVPGIERVSFGGGMLVPSATHSVFKYMDVELQQRTGNSRGIQSPSDVTDKLLAGVSAWGRWP